MDLSKVFAKQDSHEKQFESDAKIWEHTLFTPGKTGRNKENDRLKEQQDILKRHFLAMAILGVVATDSSKQASVDKIPLAAFASHGGRFAYEADNAEDGQKFLNWLFYGDVDKNFNEEELNSDFGKNGKETKSFAGLYKRKSTHGQEYKRNRWKETREMFGKECFGMNIALGGVGNTLNDENHIKTTIGYEGWSKAGNTYYQLGTVVLIYKEVLIRAQNQCTSRLMVGFEGTAPRCKNQLGAEHGLISTIKSCAGRAANEVSLTGQDKAENIINLPSGLGALKSGTLNGKIGELIAKYKQYQELERSGNAQSFFKLLLERKAGESYTFLQKLNQLPFKSSPV